MADEAAFAAQRVFEPYLRDRGFVNGRWIEAQDGRRFEVTDPSSGRAIVSVPRMGAAETRAAIAAAEAALPGWRDSTAGARAKVLKRWAALMMERQEALATLLTTEQGKPMAESRAEIAYAASFLEWFAEEGKRAYGDVIPPHRADNRIVVTKEAIGVCAGITPWNFPCAMVTRKAAPALAAGCTMVLKPAEQTPLSALALCVIAEEAGLPPGVFNVITGDGEDAPLIGKELTSNPVVRKLGFTGSTEIGKLLMAQCAPTMKRISLELGGNAPFIVFDDADLDEAVAGALLCKYRNTGQTCISANRILVQSGIHDAFVERLAAAAGQLKVGNGLDPAVSIGPLIEPAGLAKVERHVANAIDNGARPVLGGKRHELGLTFFQPTVLVGVDPKMAMCCEETFGPVAGITSFATEDEAIAIANDTPYGLASYFYTRDLARSWRVGDKLQAGIIGINTGFISTEIAPFGGIKESGIGREGSRYGLDEFLAIKYRCIGGIA
ncbi:MAG: NAD-dependent succinate-semialdehyde dehydrogenase [Microvirga sp.]|jgi:succinate-semialdehyde dehydrogenase/glutarate-semialdehyde dehydrogenase|nr:NAD-dependent succinate-semialdehyde dehydrogenase [Microvirga sp.]